MSRVRKLMGDPDVMIKVALLYFYQSMKLEEIVALLRHEHPRLTRSGVRTMLRTIIRRRIVTGTINEPADAAQTPQHELTIRILQAYFRHPYLSLRQISDVLKNEGIRLTAQGVGNHIHDARRKGILTLQINAPTRLVARLALEITLVQTFGLRVAKVVEASPETMKHLSSEERDSARRDVILRLAPLVAELVERVVAERLKAQPRSNPVVTVGWGASIHCFLEYLTWAKRPTLGPRLSVIPAIGQTPNPLGRGLDAYNLATGLAEIWGGRVWALGVWALLRRAHATQAERFPETEHVLALLKDAVVAINSIAAVKDGTITHGRLSQDPKLHAAIKESERHQSIRTRINLHFTDGSGLPVPLKHHRSIGLDLAELKRMALDEERCSITIVAPDPGRIEAVLGALRGRYISHLFIDDQMAEALLRAAGAQLPKVA